VILEGVVTTLDEDGRVNIAPMGPHVESIELSRFTLRPFRTSDTYRNLRRTGEGVLHVTDDVLLIARASVGKVHDAPTRAAECVAGRVLLGCCRYYEFRVAGFDDPAERPNLQAETVGRGAFRDFFGFNRAKHAVLEAAILATRIALLPTEEILAEIDRHRVVVEKTGGNAEREALGLLEHYVRSHAAPKRNAAP
jgi:hypothetical protein